MEFHCVIAAGLEGLRAISESSKCTLVGLGGGGLATFLLRAYPSLGHLNIIELDDAVVRVARDFFGFEDSPKCSVAIDDGIARLERLQATLRGAKHGIRTWSLSM